MAEASFRPDPQIAEIASAYSVDALDLAASNFGVRLDWSEASIQEVEKMLGRLHDEIGRAKPPEDTLWAFAKAVGSYIGEVLRRYHGGEWGMVQMGKDEFPGLQQTSGALCWPWGKAHGRILKGPEDNVWHYYRILSQIQD